MERRVYIPVFGSGLGHAARMLLIAKRLEREGIEVRFSSFADGLKLLMNSGFICNGVATVDVGWDVEGNFSYRKSIRQFPHMLVNFTRQVLDELDYIEGFDPNLILSDSRLSALFASKIKGVPCITILNQIRILLPLLEGSRIARFIEHIHAELIGRVWSFSDSIMIPDLPPPYTISEANLWNIRSVAKKIRYVGFIISRSSIDEGKRGSIVRRLGLDRSKPIIYAQVSGPSKTRARLVKTMMSVAEILARDFNFIISGGVPGGSIEPIKVAGGWYYEWCPIKDELFSLADLVVIRAGHSTIAQAISYGKPMLCIPIYKQSEQIKNAEKVEKLRCGLSIDQPDATVERVVEAINTLIHNEEYKRNVARLKLLSSKYDGIENIVNAVLSYIK
ncbi:MAG: glycosyltransferase family protein [Nitrososphaerota archaeon]|nr:hypothetical protein [Nitrososphaerales archaeon]MDW8044440.1 glycosyltransferase family protein [Nitrososphaerota archaeon]